MKILWCDVETSGLNSIEHDILSIALIAEIDGEIKDSLYFEIQPINWNTVTDEALKINGFTREQLKTFMKPQEALDKIICFLAKYVDRYKKNKTMEDKFVMSGYNVRFDSEMFSSWCKKLGYKYIGAFIDYHILDIASIVLFLKMHGKLQMEGFKLVNVASKLGMVFAAHDAKADIETTRKIAYKLLEKIEVKE